MSSIAKEIINRKLNISYFINIRASFHKVCSDELIELLLESGLCGVFVGIESFNEEDIKLFNKSSSIEDNIKVLDILCKYPINVDVGLINFHPYASIEKMKNNLIYINKYKLGSKFDLINKLLPYKETTLQKKIVDDNLANNTDNYIVDFCFKDYRVQILYDFTSKYIEYINSQSNIIEKISYYFNHHFDFVFYIKKYISNLNNDHALKIIDDYYEFLNNYKDNYNYLNCIWFSELLNLVSNGWDEEIATEINLKYLNKDHLYVSLNTLEKQKYIMFKNLYKIGLNVL
jgi:radical SAM superfamily enzyme YgiQ (UPF0313 family)